MVAKKVIQINLMSRHVQQIQCAEALVLILCTAGCRDQEKIGGSTGVYNHENDLAQALVYHPQDRNCLTTFDTSLKLDIRINEFSQISLVGGETHDER